MPESDEATSLLTVDIDRQPGLLVVRCRGKLVAGVTDILYTQVRPLIQERRRILLDLTDLTHMDSMGLGAIVRLYVSARSAGSDFELVNLGPRIRQMLSVTNLLSFFTIIGENNVRVP